MSDAPLPKLRHPVFLGGLLVALVLMLYSTTAQFDFVALDDQTHVLGNAAVRNLDIGSAFTQPHASLWIPLTWISYMVDITIAGGVKPWIFHLTNLLLHAINAVLLWRWLEGATKRRWPSLIVALLFAVHPLNVESVAWIAERKNMLSTAFWLLALIAYTRFARDGSCRAYFATLLAGAAGLMAKPMLVTLPFTLLLLDAWPFDRFNRVGWKRVLLEKIPFVLLSLGISATTVWAHQTVGGMMDAGALTLLERTLNAGTSYGLYLRQLFWPAGLGVQGRHPQEILVGAGIAGWIAVAALTAFALWYRKREPAVLWGWLWYLGTLLPVIGFLQAGSEPNADRFTYVPQFGIFVALIWSLWPWALRQTRAALAVFATVTIALAGQTAHLVGYWEDSVTLFERAATIFPRSFRANANAGFANARLKNYPRAIQYYRASLDVFPAQSETWNNLGAAMAFLGDDQQAIYAFRQALLYPPVDPAVTINLNRAEQREAARAKK